MNASGSTLAAQTIPTFPTARARMAMGAAMEVSDRLKRLRNATIGEPPPSDSPSPEVPRSYTNGELGELEGAAAALEQFNRDANSYLAELEAALLPK